MKFPNCCGIVTEGIQDEQFQDKNHQIHLSPGSNQYIVACNVGSLFLGNSRSFFWIFTKLVVSPINRVLSGCRLSEPRNFPRALLLNSMAEFQVGGCHIGRMDEYVQMWPTRLPPCYPNWLSDVLDEMSKRH